MKNTNYIIEMTQEEINTVAIALGLAKKSEIIDVSNETTTDIVDPYELYEEIAGHLK